MRGFSGGPRSWSELPALRATPPRRPALSGAEHVQLQRHGDGAELAAATLAGARGLPLPADVDLIDRVAAMGLSKGTRRDGGAAFGLGGGRESMRVAPSGLPSIEEGEGRR